METIKKREISLKTKRIIIVVNCIIILFGIITFIGWITGFDELASIQGSYIPMSRDTALFFILLGSISILLLNKKSEKVIKLFQVIVLVIALYGSLKFVEYFIHFDLTFEDLWLPASEGTDLYPVKRMSPYTGVLYMFSGVSIFLSIQKNNIKMRGNISAIFGIIIFLLSFVAVTGYIFDSPLLYGSGVIPIAVNTAFAFMLLGFSIILSTHNSYVVNYVTSNDILKTLLLTFIPLTTILIFVITLLTKVVLQNSTTNIGLFTSLVCLITLFVVIMIILPISKRITHKIDRANADLLLAGSIFESSIENAPIPIMIHAEDGTVLNISQEWTNLTKYTKSDIPTIFDWTSKAYGQNKEDVRDFINKLYKLKENQHDGEFVVNTKDGRHLIWDFNSMSIGNLPDGRAVVMSVATDVTKKSKEEEHIKQLNKELNESRSLLKSSLESTKDIIIISLDKDYRYLYFNKTHSFDMENAYNKKVRLGDCIFDFMSSEEDIKKIKSNYDIALSGKSHMTLEKYGDIEVNYYETKFNPTYDLDGRIIGLTVFSSNVTDRETANLKLKESEEKYKLLNNMIPLGMVHYQVVFDEKNKKNRYQFLEVNKTFEKQVGMKNSDLFGKTLIDVFPKTEQYWLDHFDEVVSSGNPITFEDYSVEVDGYMKISVYTLKSGILAVVIEDVTDSRRKQQQIEYLSYHDPLTSLYNRRFFEEQLKRLDNPRNLPLSIIMGDVNGLKLVNDAFGHQIGDQLLKLIGDIISTSIRGNDIAARWGGDEFTILMPSSDVDAAEVLINRIHHKIKESSFDYGSLSISFGVETKRNKDEDINDLFKSAEALMYQNKLAEIDSIRGETINTIMNTLFEKSAEVKEHSTRVSELAVSIAESMELSQSKVNDIRTIGMIHDIGKIAIDLHILDKPDKLTDDERKIVQQHPLSGSRMLSSSHEYSRLAVGVLHHHERIDGKGYPNGISGDQIPIESKIIAVADAFDAMTAQRPYRLTPLSVEEAVAELQKYSGTQFDSEIVKVFAENYIEITEK